MPCGGWNRWCARACAGTGGGGSAGGTTLFTLGGAGDDNLRFELSGLTPRLTTGRGLGAVSVDMTTPLAFDQIVELAVVVRDEEVVFYKNGVRDSAHLYAQPDPVGRGIRVGGYADGSASFRGLIDDVQLYDRALTEAQLEEIGALD